MPERPPTHRPPRAHAPDGRPSASARGYGARWRRLRAAVLAARPVCEDCRREGATDVDHVVARARGGTDDEANLRALCHACHSRKTALRDGAFGRARRAEP